MKSQFFQRTFLYLLLPAIYVNNAFSQCPTGGSTISADQTISANCTVSGNLTVSGATLTVNSGVTLTVTGTLTVRSGGTVSGSGATINVGGLAETNGGPNTISGGTYTTGSFTTGNGGAFTMTGANVNISPSAAVSIAGSTMTFTNSSISGITNWSTNVTSLVMTNTDVTASGSVEFEDLTLSGGTVSAGTDFTISGGTSTGTGLTLMAATASIRDATISNSDIDLTGVMNITNGSVTFDNSQVDVDSVSTSGGTTLTVQNNSDFVVTNGMRNLEDLIINGSFMQIGGDLDASGGDNITVSNGGELLVQGDYQMNGGGIQLGVEGGSLVRVQGDVESSNGGNTIDVDGDSGIAVDGDFIGSTPPTVSVGAGDDGTDCITTGGCCGDASACGTATTLPVSLMSFSNRVDETIVTLEWSTASELNNDFFTIERSADGLNFVEICRVAGAGTINEVSSYSHTDRLSSASIAYYRLSQTDYDGTHEILGIISAATPGFSSQLAIYPNPVQSFGEVWLSGVPAGSKWAIYSLAGERLFSGQLAIEGSIEISDLTKGTYVLKVEESSESRVLIVR